MVQKNKQSNIWTISIISLIIGFTIGFLIFNGFSNTGNAKAVANLKTSSQFSISPEAVCTIVSNCTDASSDAQLKDCVDNSIGYQTEGWFDDFRDWMVRNYPDWLHWDFVH